MKKYELTDETMTLPEGPVLHRIRALRDISLADGTSVCRGGLGGWVENESNLSHEGSSWVAGMAKVYDNAKVCDDAVVSGSASVRDDATIRDSAKVCEGAVVFGHASVYGCATVKGDARVYDGADIYGSAKVYDNARVYGCAKVYFSAQVYGLARIRGFAKVCGSAEVSDLARVLDRATVCCVARVGGVAEIGGDAILASSRDYAVYKNTWSSLRWFTYTRSNRKWRVGCFYGAGEELIAKAYEDSDLSGRCYEAIVRAQEAIDGEVAE